MIVGQSLPLRLLFVHMIILSLGINDLFSLLSNLTTLFQQLLNLLSWVTKPLNYLHLPISLMGLSKRRVHAKWIVWRGIEPIVVKMVIGLVHFHPIRPKSIHPLANSLLRINLRTTIILLQPHLDRSINNWSSLLISIRNPIVYWTFDFCQRHHRPIISLILALTRNTIPPTIKSLRITQYLFTHIISPIFLTDDDLFLLSK